MNLYSPVNVSETPTTTAAVVVEKKEFIYETKEEAKQAFKELLKEKVGTQICGVLSPVLSYWRSSLSIIALCACVYICIWQLSSSAPTLWFIDLTVATRLAIFNNIYTFLQEFMPLPKSAIFIWYENDHWWLLHVVHVGIQSINNERAPFWQLHCTYLDWWP